MAEADDVMPLDEARERFAGKWLALEAVSRDENHMPARVRVIEQGDAREEVCERTRAVREVYITFGGPPTPEGRTFPYLVGSV